MALGTIGNRSAAAGADGVRPAREE